MSESLTRSDVRRILSRARGECSRLARDLGVSPATVHLVLKGKTTSERIMVAAEDRARLLLDEEKMDAA